MSQTAPTSSRRGRRRRRNVTGKKGVRDAEVRGFVNAAEACGQVRKYRAPNSRPRHLFFSSPTSLAPGSFDATLRATHPTSPGSRLLFERDIFGVFPIACLSFVFRSQPANRIDEVCYKGMHLGETQQRELARERALVVAGPKEEGKEDDREQTGLRSDYTEYCCHVPKK
jgi:hypothetical protein